MQVTLVDRQLNQAGTLEVADALFAKDWNAPLVHRLAVAHAANGREGTRQQKNRAQVKHTTKKLFRQKGTGRARAGMSTSPIRRGGGRAFPATPSDNLRKELNRKEFRLGMATMLSQLVREDRLFVAEEIASDVAKTKPCAKMLVEFAAQDKVLFVDTEFDHNFGLAVRNIPKAKLVEFSRLLAPDLLRYERTVISKRAVDAIVKYWS